MKRNSFLFFIFFINVMGLKAQDFSFLTNKDLDWEKWERQIDKTQKLSDIIKINDDLIEFLVKNKMLDNYLEHFHSIDFDGNGDNDIIYSGPGLAESNQTIFYKKQKENYEKVFDVFGQIVSIWDFYPGSPICFMIIHYPFDPPDILRNLEVYLPILENNEIRFRYSIGIRFIEHTVFPENNTLHIPFLVKNDSYFLRLSPEINNDTDYFNREVLGNTIAEYPKGAKGLALAEKKDETGRVWWFVLMFNNEDPKNSFFSDLGSNNINGKYLNLGWMSSNFLEVIK